MGIKKEPRPRSVSNRKKTTTKNAANPSLFEQKIRNGLSDAIGFNPGQNPGSSQLSQLTTLFKNERWYLLSNIRQLLSEMYMEHGLVQTIVGVPVDDGLRNGFTINSQQLSPDQIKELQISIDRENILNIVGDALKWNRLYGGAGVLVVTDQDPSEPLDIAAINRDTPLEWRALDLWELFWTNENTDSYDSQLQEQLYDYYSYYTIKLDKSRVLKLKGLTAPSFLRPRLRGWGVSVCEHLVRSINQYLKANDLVFEVLDEFKLDIYKMKNLVDTLLSPTGAQQVSQRIQQANWNKNYQNALILDSEDDYIQKQLTFAGIADMQREFRMQIASDMRMPLIKLFGIGATGMNSSNEEELEVYNAMVESEVRNKSKFIFLRILEIKCQQLFGYIPDDLSIEFESLRMLSAVDEENVKTSKFNRIMQARQIGEINSLEFRDACNKDNLLGITLETSEYDVSGDHETKASPRAGGLGPNIDGAESDGDPNPYSTNRGPQDDPGANRSDTRSPNLREPSTTQPDIPHRKQVSKNSDFKESEHPRAKDGEFTSGGGGGRTSKGKETESESSGQSSSFETKKPEQSNMKTKSINDVVEGVNTKLTGKISSVPYMSPKPSTCNLVGYVAFGKAKPEIQKKLNEHVQTAEILLSNMGVKFKTPIDFVCQTSIPTANAELILFKNKDINHRINISNKKDELGENQYPKSIMHEIGHAIDYGMNDDGRYSTASENYYSKSEDLKNLHEQLKEIVTSSKYYTQEPRRSELKYLSSPKEIFARGFEVYSYAKALELSNKGMIPKNFIDNFKPDIFIDKDQKTPFLDFTKIPKSQQKEYMDKISAIMDEMIKKDPIKNAMINVSFQNSSNFDRATYEAHGGDAWIDARKKYFYTDPDNVDEKLWQKAKEASLSAFGIVKWQFVTWWYKQAGGRFS